MAEQGVGLISSWRALVRERGWYKPILVLAAVSWMPILGWIATLGYSYEWARRAAWGIDAAPQQRSIDYGALLSTGGRTLLVLLTMCIPCAACASLVLGARGSAFFPLDYGVDGLRFIGGSEGLRTVLFIAGGPFGALFMMLVGAFILAAMMRAVIYDAFGAGWRLDRLFQMIRRDAGGFMRVLFANAIGCAVAFACSWLAAGLLGSVAAAGFAGLAWHDGALQLFADSGGLLQYVLSLSPSLGVMGIVLLAVAAYAVRTISVALQLMVVHAAGCWFNRFEVARWGVSSDELPAGVPRHG